MFQVYFCKRLLATTRPIVYFHKYFFKLVVYLVWLTYNQMKMLTFLLQMFYLLSHSLCCFNAGQFKYASHGVWKKEKEII